MSEKQIDLFNYNKNNRKTKPKTKGDAHKRIFGTYEWAVHNVNCINGCIHNCKYCYSKAMAIQYGRKTPTTWQNEEVKEKNLKKSFRHINGRLMFPSSHDITPD